MDAAQKLLKNIAILTAAALLLSTVGLAATTLVAPSTVAIGATGYNTADVSSSDGTTIITYSIGTPSYTGGDPAWLAVSGVGTTPSTLTFTAHSVAGLSAALHSATVTLTPTSPAGLAAVTITVTYDTSGGGGGGGTSTLTASNTTVSLDSIHTSATVDIGTTSFVPVSTSVTWAVQSGATSWLSATQLNPFVVSPGATSILTIYGVPTGLTAGTYQGTVTVTPNINTGTPLTITVTLTVGAAGGGAWSGSPRNITWNYATGGISPTQVVTVTTTSGESSYSVNTTQTGNYHWLLVAGNGGTAVSNVSSIPVGAPFTLSVGSQANNLQSGAYTDQAVVSDAFGAEQFRVTVTLTVNGGASAGLTISPGTVTLAAAVYGAMQSQVISVTSSTGGTLSVAGCNVVTWLTCTLPSNTTLQPNVAVGFTVYGNPVGFPASTQNGTLQIQVGSQSGTVSVSLVIGGGGGGAGSGVVSPSALVFAYEFGTNTSFVTQQKLVITGTPGAWSLTKTVGSPAGGTWLKVSPSSGSALPDPLGGTPLVSVDPTGLVVGDYSGSITVTTAGGAQVINVTLHVQSSTIILPNPAGMLIFTAQVGQPKPAPQGLFWSDSDNGLSLGTSPVTATTGNLWISLTGPVQGSVTVHVDHSALSAGVYSGSIVLTQTGAANSPTTVPVILVVYGAGGAVGPLTFAPNSFSFSSTNGSTPTAAQMQVGADAPTSFDASIAYLSGSGSWLTVTNQTTNNTINGNGSNMLAGSTPVNLLFSVNPTGLLTGSYGATISFTASIGTVVQTVNVTLTVNNSGGGVTGNVTVSPTALTFAATQGSSPAATTVSVTSAAGAAGIPFTTQVTAGAAWLSTSAGVSNSTPATLTISVNSSALAANTYSGNILITPAGGTAVNIPVTLTVTGLGSISAAPTQLTFAYRTSDPAPAAQQITVAGSGAFTATATSTGNWLVATPTAGTAPGTVNVTINTANITGTGSLNGTVVVAGTGGASGSTTVNVTLNVTSPLPTISRVTNAASYATNAISPGEIITIFGNDPTHPIGPATPAFLTLDANGNVATTLGGVQVTVAGYSCPMIYASASQVSAVVPYEVNIYATATVLVKFLGQGSNGILMNVVTTVPGVFTYDSSGTGPGAILNSDLSVNTAANPAARGDIVVLYITGEGQTSPGGVTGKVTTVASPPAPLTPGPLLQPSVTIGSQPALWTFAGEAPGFVSGVMQLNVKVPTNIAAGNQPVVVTLGGVGSQSGVTVALK